MNSNRFKYLVSFSFALLALAGCVKKEDFNNVILPDWKPTEAAPIVNSTLSLKDIVNTKMNLQEDQNGFYTFIYKDTSISPAAGDLIQLPDQSNKYSIGVPSAAITPFPKGQTYSHTYTQDFTTTFNGGAKLKYVDLKGGSLGLNFSSRFRHNVSMNITFNSIVKNGTPLTRSYNLNYTGVVPGTMNDNIDLTGYRVDLSKGGTTANNFEYTVSFNLTSTGNAITTADSLSIAVNLKSLKFSLMYGDIGVFPINPYAGDLVMSVFDKTVIGDLYFEDPSLNITFDNSFGVPVSFTVDRLETTTSEGTVTPVTSTVFQAPVNLAYPSSTEIGQSKSTLITLDKNNSNIREVLAPAPNKLSYSITTKVGATGSGDKFVTDTSRVKVFLEARIPLYGRVHVYALQDTVDVSLPKSEYVEKATIKLKAENSLPVNVSLQTYFLDPANNSIMDSLIVPPDDIVVSGNVNGNGDVTSPSVKYTIINIDKAKYDKIATAKKMIIRGSLITTNDASTSVKIYSYYKLKIQLSVLADLKVKLQ